MLHFFVVVVGFAKSALPSGCLRQKPLAISIALGLVIRFLVPIPAGEWEEHF